MTTRFTLRQLEYLIAVGETGSIAAAAERVNVSSPSISTAISQLERELGAQLFVRRHAQGLSLTPGGRRIFNEARRIVHDAGRLYAVAGETRDLPSGPLTVGYLTSIAPVLAAGVRRGFEAAYPEATLTMRVGDQAELMTMLNRAEIDLAVTYDIELPPDDRFAPVTALSAYAALAADHPLARRESVTVEELVEEPMVLLDLPLSREYMLAAFHDAGLRPWVAERSPDLAVVRSLVANGFGFSLLNLRTRTREALDGAPLAFVALAGSQRPLTLGVLSKTTTWRSRLQAAFEEHLRALAESGELPGLG
ncbi:MAG: LysR family transcriptional regulator [Pseudomonadota bacterium]